MTEFPEVVPGAQLQGKVCMVTVPSTTRLNFEDLQGEMSLSLPYGTIFRNYLAPLKGAISFPIGSPPPETNEFLTK